MIRNIIKLLVLIVFFTTSSCDTKKSKPNFIIIQLDDLGWDDISLHGNDIIETPNIDKLGKESLQFNQFYVNSVCAPTRAALLTGRDFLRTGISHVNGGKGYLNLNETTIAEVLKSSGYVTGMWGKWHSGYNEGYYPWDRGFDEAYVIKSYSHENNYGEFNGEKVEHNKWSDEVIIDYAIDFIRKNKEKPFLAYIPSITCHTPLKAPEKHVIKYKKKGLSDNLAILYGMIDHFDYQLKRLLDEVEKLGLDDNTVIVFMSDNGPAVNNGEFTDNDRQIRYVSKLKGHKGNIWENGVKSPLFIKWGENINPKITDNLVGITDIFPTIIDLAGIKLPENNLPLDGKSIKKIIKGDVSVEQQEKLIFNYVNIGWPPTKAPWTPEGTNDEYRPVDPDKKSKLKLNDQIISVRNNTYKLLLNPDVINNGGSLEYGYALYNILLDPREEINIIAEEEEMADALKEKLKQWYNTIKKSPHSYKMPVFLIGKNNKKDNYIQGVAPVRISHNLKNTVHTLNNWKEVGDFAEYSIDVLNPGKYSIILNYNADSVSGNTTIAATVGNNSISNVIVDNSLLEIGEIYLNKGKLVLRIELTNISDDNLKVNFNKLKGIQLIFQ